MPIGSTAGESIPEASQSAYASVLKAISPRIGTFDPNISRSPVNIFGGMPKAKCTLLDTLTKGFDKNFGERVKEQVEMEAAATKKKGGAKKKGE